MNTRERLWKGNRNPLQRSGWEKPWRDIWFLVNCLSKQESRMVGTEESSGMALGGVRIFGFLAPVLTLNKEVTLHSGASVSSDIRQKQKSMNLSQLSRERSIRWKALQEWEVQHRWLHLHALYGARHLRMLQVAVCPCFQAGTMEAASCTTFSNLEHSVAWEGCDLPGQCQHACVVQKCPPFSKPLSSGFSNPSKANF